MCSSDLETVYDTKFIGNLEGLSGIKGIKGTFLTLCFSKAHVYVTSVAKQKTSHD